MKTGSPQFPKDNKHFLEKGRITVERGQLHAPNFELYEILRIENFKVHNNCFSKVTFTMLSRYRTRGSNTHRKTVILVKSEPHKE